MIIIINKTNSYNYHKIHFVARLLHLTCARYFNSTILGVVSCAKYFNSTILGEFRVKTKVHILSHNLALL